MGPHEPLAAVEIEKIRQRLKRTTRTPSGSQFPKLNIGTCKIIGPLDHRYNCIAFTVGYTEGHIWPIHEPAGFWPDEVLGGILGETEDTFRQMYRRFGFACYYPVAPEKCHGATDVAVYAKGKVITHAAIRKGIGPWCSKVGRSGPVIEHELEELEGGIYGTVSFVVRY
jgi:hypothetical protein